MKLLILGGTQFLGRHIVESALRRGHGVSIFTRGQSNPELFPEVEKLRGDRDGNLEALRGGRWDAVIDTSGFVPRVVRDSAELLAECVERYVFISSISAYSDFDERVHEKSPAAKMADESVEEVGGETYGPLKALCERAVEEVMPGRALHVRPGLIVGPHDTTVRFVYWPRRVARGGEVLAPGRPERLLQFIDARDLSDWIVRMTEARATGVYNATGPDYELTMGDLLSECERATGGDARFTWVDDEFLLEHGVEPWTELPLWLTPGVEKFRYFMEANVDKALRAGLTFRPLSETIRDTCVWDEACPDNSAAAGSEPGDGDDEPDPTLKPERERELLDEWHARTGPA